jgi:hypothetical protein
MVLVQSVERTIDYRYVIVSVQHPRTKAKKAKELKGEQ